MNISSFPTVLWPVFNQEPFVLCPLASRPVPWQEESTLGGECPAPTSVNVLETCSQSCISELGERKEKVLLSERAPEDASALNSDTLHTPRRGHATCDSAKTQLGLFTWCCHNIEKLGGLVKLDPSHGAAVKI